MTGFESLNDQMMMSSDRDLLDSGLGVDERDDRVNPSYDSGFSSEAYV